MNRASTPKSFYVDNNYIEIVLIVLSVLAIGVFLVYSIINVYKNSTIVASPSNINRIKLEQSILLEKEWTGISQGRKGLEDALNTIPEDQQLLINATVFSTRLTGYLGPYASGVFSEDDATRYALNSGARCIILEIDRMNNSYDPILLYRDEWGVKQSLNSGNILKVAKSISSRAFLGTSEGSPPNVSNDPLFVVVYFVSTPDPTTNTKEYVRFMAKVAQALQPLKNQSLGLTPQGDFRRQGLESQLFFTPYKVFLRKILIFTNADTTPFRRLQSLGLSSEIGQDNDLDLLVHARIYSRESPSGLGISSSPVTNTKPNVCITTPYYWLNTPPDRLADAQTQTKSCWTIVMPPVSSAQSMIEKENLTKLYTTYGIQSIPFCLFDSKTTTSLFTGKDAPYHKASWQVKPEILRFIPPKPIAVQKPMPETNSSGGAVVTPSF